MTPPEARRRHLVQSLLQAEGLALADYRDRFGSTPVEDFPAEFEAFAARGWLAEDSLGVATGPADRTDPAERLRLSPEGLAHSDAVGPMLFSPEVRALMAEYEAK